MLEIFGTSYYLATGDYGLDFNLLAYTFLNIGELFPVLMSEAKRGFGIWSWVLLLISLGIGQALFRYGPHTTAPAQTRATPNMARWCTLLIFVGMMSAASLPSLYSRDRVFAQTLSANILLTGVARLTRDEVPADTPPVRERYPLNGRVQSATPGTATPNLVVIVLESTRASALTPYNPALDTTPFLARLSESSTVFERTYTMVPHTSKSMLSLLCGIEPSLSQPVLEGASPDGIPAKCLAAVLRDAGFTTAFFTTGKLQFENNDQMIRNIGFDHIVSAENLSVEGFEKVNYFGLEDKAILTPSEEWLSARDDIPFFVLYQTITSHHSYKTPTRFTSKRYSDDPLLNDYLNTVRYVDEFTSDLFDQFKRLGLYENSLFVIVADHGEGFGEHGIYVHDTVIYNEGLQIPFLIHDPQRAMADRVATPLSAVDVMPTILEHMGLKLDGQGYAGVPASARHDDQPIFSHCWRVRQCMSIIRGQKKYIHFFGHKQSELYDLSTDPDETNNIIQAFPDLARSMEIEVMAWHDGVQAYYRTYYMDRVTRVQAD